MWSNPTSGRRRPSTPAWNTYVAVDDADDAARRIGGAGGRVLFGPSAGNFSDLHAKDPAASAAETLGGTVLHRGDTAWTRDALLRDPQGAVFTVSQFTPPG
jgi:hypothetical protein